ncbi:MAG: aspartyl/glutamyl-tRNA(Asn/Gln) amidotransferase subunit B [marine bacterium B5-7]|nr:MAG: aspartyl/glutamyl-tRNA(Asn/Gln) amidotransferase subunit B [marine bacterium B5-7]
MSFESVIGLEVHVQLKTSSKIFSGSSIAFGAEPNTQANAVDIALPGVLPVMNREAVTMAVRFGLAVNGLINQRSIFARKNYFYPDLPKGYQISQYEIPVVGPGYLDIEVEGKSKRIGITRAHLEEDAGKSLHEDFHGMTGIDLNRAGTPLLEVVSDPDMRTATEAVVYLRKLHTLVRYLGICDGNMQEGSFRCDANISVRRRGEDKLGTRAEIKNINSFRFVDKAIQFEIARQIEIIEDGGTVVQETRLYDPTKDETRSMRSKEEAHDYRYFPDPDLPPLVITESFIEDVRRTLPELAHAKRERFIREYSLNSSDAEALVGDLDIANYFEAIMQSTAATAKAAANWITGDISARINREGINFENIPVTPLAVGQLLDRIQDGTISGKIAKDVFQAMWDSGDTADNIIDARGLRQISDSGALEEMVDEVLSNSAAQVQQYREGETKVIGYLVGQIMKLSQGKANPRQVNEILKRKLDD